MSDHILIENQKNQEYVEKNLDALKKVFLDKFVVVHHQEVVAIFHTFQEASEFGVSKFGLKDAFLIYHLEDKKPVNFVIHVKRTGFIPYNQNLRMAFE